MCKDSDRIIKGISLKLSSMSDLPSGVALATGLMLDELPCELGVVDFPVGVVGFSSFLLLLFVEGVLEFEDPPLRGLFPPGQIQSIQSCKRRKGKREKKGFNKIQSRLLSFFGVKGVFSLDRDLRTSGTE